MALSPPQGGFTIPSTAYPKSSASSTSTSGFDWGSAAGSTLQGLLGNIANFNVPATAAPTSTSTSTGGSTSTGTNQATSAQQSTGSNQAQSAQQAQSLQNSLGQTGINWGNPVNSAILPQLISSAQALPGVANNMGQTVQDQYSSLMNQAMGPQAFQGTLNELASRNMLNSSVAGNAMAQTAVPIAQAIGNQGWQSSLAGQQAQMQVPTSLAQLAQLGQESTNQSTGSSVSGGTSTSTGQQQSTGTSQSTGNQQSSSTQASDSLNTNPLAAYQTMAQFYPSILQALGGVGRESDASQTSTSTNELSPYELMAQMMIANQMA